MAIMTIEGVKDIDPNGLLRDFHYQDNLTQKLDEVSGGVDQSIINEIVLWKVHRLASQLR